MSLLFHRIHVPSCFQSRTNTKLCRHDRNVIRISIHHTRDTSNSFDSAEVFVRVRRLRVFDLFAETRACIISWKSTVAVCQYNSEDTETSSHAPYYNNYGCICLNKLRNRNVYLFNNDDRPSKSIEWVLIMTLQKLTLTFTKV